MFHLCSDLGEQTENDIFKFHKHRKGMVRMFNTLFSSVAIAEHFKMVVLFFPKDDNADGDIKFISESEGYAAPKRGSQLCMLDEN